MNTNNIPNWTIRKKALFKATVSPNNASNKKLTWRSSNPKVPTVDQNGNLTGVSAGNTTVTCIAKDGSGIKVKCKVTVVSSQNQYSISSQYYSNIKIYLSIKNGKSQTGKEVVVTIDNNSKRKINKIVIVGKNGYTLKKSQNQREHINLQCLVKM